MLIIGCGRLGGIFARIWREREPDDGVVCTVRRPESFGRLEGFDVRQLDLLDPKAVGEVVSGHLRILVSVVGEAAWTAGMRNLAAAVAPDAHVIHISSTGIYAEDQGGVVQEESPLLEGSPLVAAEDALVGLRATVLRCSGLVDPGHEPSRMLQAFAGTSRPDGWLNLVRRDDVAEVVAEAFGRSITGTFNLSALTVRRSEFLGPRLEAAGLDPVEWTAAETGKRVDCAAFGRSFQTRLNPLA
jgi:nucleoside-diphosphate-sugar epimerase